MNNDNIIGLFEIAFRGVDRGLEVKQFGEKDEVTVDTPLEPEKEIEIGVITVNPNMEVPGLTPELLNKIHANASVRVTENEIARRKAIEEYMKQQKETDKLIKGEVKGEER